MATRKVRTPAGAKFYGLPIGSTITADGAGDEGQGAVVTLVRLRSLQRQMMQAARVGDTGKVKMLQGTLSQAFQAFAKGRGVMQATYEMLDFDETDALKNEKSK